MSPKLLPENFHEKQTDEKPEEFVEKSIREKISHEIGTNTGKIGISLSSGIDSTLILALLREEYPSNEIESVSVKFRESTDETDASKKISEKLESSWQIKNIVKNGYQSTGNLLDKPFLEITVLKKKIEKQISIYRKNYKNSDDYYISRWPTKSKLIGWYIKLKKQGQLKSHMHPTGWLSGVFYLRVPKPLKKNEGSINLFLQGFDYPYDEKLPNLYYAPKPFDLILYPSSLFHFTVPFTSNEERHCIAFDVTPITQKHRNG